MAIVRLNVGAAAVPLVTLLAVCLLLHLRVLRALRREIQSPNPLAENRDYSQSHAVLRWTGPDRVWTSGTVACPGTDGGITCARGLVPVTNQEFCQFI